MGTYSAFLVGCILAAFASAQQPSPPSIPSVPIYKFEGHVVPSGDWIQINAPEVIDSAGKVRLPLRSFDVKSGAFVFWPLPAGAYTVRVSGMMEENPGLNNTIFTTHKVVVAADLTDVKLALCPGTSILVTVRKESQHPVERCWWNPLTEKVKMADCSDYRAAEVQLVPVYSSRSPYISGAGVLKDPTHFRMAGIEPDKYIVRVRLPSYPANYVQSVHSGNLDLLQEPLDVADYESVLPLDIVVRDDFGLVKLQAHGAAEPVIVLIREDILHPAPEIPTQFLEQDPENKTEFSFLVAPGSYAVFVFDSVKGNPFDPEFLSKYAARAVKVTVSANETRSVKVDVIHTED